MKNSLLISAGLFSAGITFGFAATISRDIEFTATDNGLSISEGHLDSMSQIDLPSGERLIIYSVTGLDLNGDNHLDESFTFGLQVSGNGGPVNPRSDGSWGVFEGLTDLMDRGEELEFSMPLILGSDASTALTFEGFTGADFTEKTAWVEHAAIHGTSLSETPINFAGALFPIAPESILQENTPAEFDPVQEFGISVVYWNDHILADTPNMAVSSVSGRFRIGRVPEPSTGAALLLSLTFALAKRKR